MNLRTTQREKLVDIVIAAANAIAAGKVKGYTPEQCVAVSTALLERAASLNSANENVFATRSAAQSATATAQVEHNLTVDMMIVTKHQMRGMDATPEEYSAVGFKAPASATRVDPQTPTALSATGQSNYINKLKLKGNNTPGSVIYVFEANTGSGWFMIGTTGKQTFIHEGVVPGQPHEYRARAQASSGETSDWSTTASVYGPIAR